MQKIGITISALLMIVVASLSFVGCGGEEAKIVIDGSSTVYPISDRMLNEFRKVNADVNISVGTSGTGGGFVKFGKGETDISDASRPIKAEEAEECKKNNIEFIELPVAYDGLSIVVSTKNTFCNELTTDQLFEIFAEEGSAKTWKDVNDAWPAEPISIFAPGEASGTFDYFQEVILKKKKASLRKGSTTSESDSTLVTGIQDSEFAIGFFGYAYFDNNRETLKALKINGVAPGAETIENGTYAPFSRPLFIYVAKSAADKEHVAQFVSFYLEKAPNLVADVGYFPLPDSVYAATKKRFADRVTGSVYAAEDAKKKTLSELYK